MEEPRGRRIERSRAAYSRWQDIKLPPVPGLPTFLPAAVLSTEELEALLLRFRVDEVGNKLQNNLLDVDLRARSPSPPQLYDSMGKRLNTKEQRGKDKLMAERQRLVERARVILPAYKPPADYRPFTTKKVKKIYVPVKEYPDYNFIGLILGPRGLTHKQMEKDTGVKIAIRGRGSVKDGKGRTATKDNNDDEEQHIVLTAETEEALEHAERLIRGILVPVEDGKNEHKQKQLRKLAELNGTLRDEMYGLPEEIRNRTWVPSDVKCKWCGEISHPSSDCPQKGQLQPQAGAHHNANASSNRKFGSSNYSNSVEAPPAVDQAYIDLMRSLGEDVSGMVPATAAPQNDMEKGYKDLLQAISGIPGASTASSSAGGIDNRPRQYQDDGLNPWDRA